MSQRTTPAKIINDGRVTIPVEVRKDLGIEKGDYVLIDVQPIAAGDSDA